MPSPGLITVAVVSTAVSYVCDNGTVKDNYKSTFMSSRKFTAEHLSKYNDHDMHKIIKIQIPPHVHVESERERELFNKSICSEHHDKNLKQ